MHRAAHRAETHLAGRSGESPLLEKVEGLTSGEHYEEDGGIGECRVKNQKN